MLVINEKLILKQICRLVIRIVIIVDHVVILTFSVLCVRLPKLFLIFRERHSVRYCH